jgi:hypothetical protein
MKKIITLLAVILFSINSYSQTTTQPDTVCVDATNEQYFVTNVPGNTYNWTTTNGVVSTGQGTNSITVDYTGVVSGLHPNLLEIIETNSSNCPGLPIYLDIYVLNLNLTQIGPFCVGDPTSVLIGSPLNGIFTGTGVVGTSFNPSTAGLGNHIITYTLGGCSTTINIVVNNGPITGPISHY